MMFYYLSKIIWFGLQPSSLIFLCLLIGFFLVLLRGRGGRLLLFIGLFGVLVFGFSPVPRWMMEHLEYQSLATTSQNQNPPVGTILLGGFVDTVTSTASGQLMTTDSADRLLTAQLIVAEFTDQPLVITGGSNPLVSGLGEAELVGAFLQKINLNHSKVYLENEARNTAQNATKTLALIESKMPGLERKPWRLVTSAFHMKRSMAIFKKAGMDVIPFPTDFRSEALAGGSVRGYRSFALGLKDTDIVAKEQVGYFVYWLTGRL
jgi:uncharacterized SAM-binding protein YcdF (DUF218 family)